LAGITAARQSVNIKNTSAGSKRAFPTALKRKISIKPEEDIIRNLFLNSFRAIVEDDPDNIKTDKMNILPKEPAENSRKARALSL